MDEQRLRDNIEQVSARIAAAAHRAGRKPEEVGLVAVSKTHTASTVALAYSAGLRVFGENRVEEAAPKAAAVASLVSPAPPPAWHLVGHLQSRKAADALGWACMVHSVDSVKLAARLDRALAQQGQGEVLPVLLEVNVSGEESKFGFTPGVMIEAIEGIAPFPHLRIEGLMTMAPLSEHPEAARPVFVALRRLRDDLAVRFPSMELRRLSMGMTDDFEVAIEEGATLVRVGRALFGER